MKQRRKFKAQARPGLCLLALKTQLRKMYNNLRDNLIKKL